MVDPFLGFLVLECVSYVGCVVIQTPLCALSSYANYFMQDQKAEAVKFCHFPIAVPQESWHPRDLLGDK